MLPHDFYTVLVRAVRLIEHTICNSAVYQAQDYISFDLYMPHWQKVRMRLKPVTHQHPVTSCKWLDHWRKRLENTCVCMWSWHTKTKIPVIKRPYFQMKFYLQQVLTWTTVFFICMHFQWDCFSNSTTCYWRPVYHDISKKSSHLKTCNLAPVCHQL